MHRTHTLIVPLDRVKYFDPDTRTFYPASDGPPVPAALPVPLNDPAGPFAKLSPTQLGQQAGRRWALEHATWEDLDQLRAEVEKGHYPLFLNSFADSALEAFAEMEGRPADPA